MISTILLVVAFVVALIASVGPDSWGPFKLLPLAVALIALAMALPL